MRILAILKEVEAKLICQSNQICVVFISKASKFELLSQIFDPVDELLYK